MFFSVNFDAESLEAESGNRRALIEATAFGNVLVQARTAGAISGDLSALRALLRETQQIVRYEPRGVIAICA